MDVFVLKDSVTGGMTDDEFLRFCLENPNLRIERNSDLEIIIMTPVTTLASYSSGQAFARLSAWNDISKAGLVFDSSAGFTLPDRSVLSPDASWVSKKKWNMLTEDDKNRFAPLCPEFVIEVRSKSDTLSDLKKKMAVWIKNGAQLAWLIDPQEKVSYVYHADGTDLIVKGFDKKLEGEGPVAGFVLELSSLII